MRKTNLTIAFFFTTLTVGFSQEVTVSTEMLPTSEKKEKYKYQSIDQYDQRFLFKLSNIDVVPGSTFVDGYNLPFDLFSIEYKFSKTMSFEGAYYFPSSNLNAVSFKLKRYLEREPLANNLSGKYVAVEYSNILNNTQSFDTFLGTNQALFLHFGNQIKKTRFGYADFRLFSRYNFGGNDNSLNLGINVALGAAWGPLGKRSLPSTSTSFLYSKDRTIVTIENPVFITGQIVDSFGFSSSVERAIFLKGLTSRTTLSLEYSQQENSQIAIEAMSFSVSQEIRKYFALLKKPSADLPVHSFSGLYAGVGVNDFYVNQKVKVKRNIEESYEVKANGDDLAVTFLSLGYQERMGKKYFFDVFARYSFSPFVNYPQTLRGDSWLIFGTRVGFSWGW